MSPVDFERLPPVALDDLAHSHMAIESEITWPHQVMMTLGRLPPKKTEGYIIIGLLSMFADCGVSSANLRSGGGPRPPPLTGARRRARGNAALREAFIRALEAEVGRQLGVASGVGAARHRRLLRQCVVGDPRAARAGPRFPSGHPVLRGAPARGTAHPWPEQFLGAAD
eukprot:3765366-Pyramimonas_sp.AAC.2